MRVKQWNTVTTALTVAGVLAGVVALLSQRPQAHPASYIALALLAAAAAVHFWKFRCPACHRVLPNQNAARITHCPFCGASLE